MMSPSWYAIIWYGWYDLRCYQDVKPQVIPLRVVVLLGDIFSCHAVDNPDTESEMSMLRQYGPDVPESVLRKLVLAFGELRNMADQGLITYPYSTREVVNMVKHLQVLNSNHPTQPSFDLCLTFV